MKSLPLRCAVLLTALMPFPVLGKTVYWDSNADTPGAGLTPTGTWGTSSFWTEDSTGATATTAWVAGDTAVFSAGTDAVDAYTVTLGAAQTAGGLTVEEGTMSLAGSALTVGTGTLTVGSGAKLSIPLTTNLVASAGANLNLNGGTLRNTSNGAGSTFVSALVTINLDPVLGGTVETTNTGTNSAIYAGTIKGVGGTLTKTGSGEFRFQGAGTGTTTFSKLVVNQGLFRLGNVASNNFETGLGAVPATTLADAITLSNGAAIGSSYNLTLASTRGITLGTGGGGFFTSAASLVVPSPITGGGPLTKSTSGTVTLSGANDYTGDTLITGSGVVVAGSATALGSTAGVTKISTAAEVRFDGAATNFTIDEPFQIAGPGGGGGGALVVQNSAVVTLTGPITLTGDTTLAVAGTSTVTYTNAASITSLANQNLTLQGGSGVGSGGTITGAVALGSGGITKLQGGRWTLAGANNYTGPTTITAGTLVVSGSISTSNAINVQTGATIQLAGSSADRVGDSVPVGLTGTASVVLSGDITEAVGPLTVNAGAATLNFGTGTCALTFANSATQTWTGTLTVTNWSGSLTGGGQDQLRFGAGGLTSAQLAAITFTNPAGFPAGTYGAGLLPSGEVVPMTPFAAWQLAEFGANATDPLIAGPTADPDKDGNTNLLEYALVGTPTNPNPSQLFTLGQAGGKITLAFQRNTSRNDITIRVQSSATLSPPWVDEAVSVNGAAFTITAPATVDETGTGSLKSVLFTDSTAISASPRRFLRIISEKQ